MRRALSIAAWPSTVIAATCLLSLIYVAAALKQPAPAALFPIAWFVAIFSPFAMACVAVTALAGAIVFHRVESSAFTLYGISLILTLAWVAAALLLRAT